MPAPTRYEAKDPDVHEWTGVYHLVKAENPNRRPDFVYHTLCGKTYSRRHMRPARQPGICAECHFAPTAVTE